VDEETGDCVLIF